MPVRLALGARKGGAGGTITSLLLALGLARQGRPVHMVEIVDHALRPAFVDGAALPFRYTSVAAPDGEADVLAVIEAAARDGADLVLDLCPAALQGWDRLLRDLDLLLIPVRPGPQEKLAALDSWRDVRQRLAASGAKPMTPWLLPVAWTSADQARREMTMLWDARTALSGEDALADIAIVPWTVPRLLPSSLDLLFDPETLDHAPHLRLIADLLARAAALRLAEAPDGAFADAAALFGTIDGLDPTLVRGAPWSGPERLVALGEDLARFRAGQRPTQAELEAAPVLEAWRLDPVPRFVLEGRVRGHPTQPDGHHRTALLFYRDAGATFARTLDGLYRLGRQARNGS